MPLRMTCDVCIVSHPESSAEGRTSQYPIPACLSLPKPPKGRLGSAYVRINIDPHRRSTKFKLRENIDQLFTKFVDDGKATLRLKEPAVDICLSKV